MSAVMAVPAYAAAEGAESDGAIVVTARRFEENAQDVPISMTVFSQEEITSRNISNSAELAAYTPSLTVNSRFGPEKASFSIRGFSQELNTLPTVGVYFADVIAPRLSSNITSGNGAGVGNMFDLQSVQVLKGPQGTLFGRNTTGGAILLVPQRPTGEVEGYVEGTYGNYNQARAQAVLNIPVNDSISVRGGLDWNKRNGYLKNQSGIGPKDMADLQYISARLSILAQITPTLENYTIGTFIKSDNNNSVGRVAFCNRTPGVGPGGRALIRQDICNQIDRQNARGDGFFDVENSHPDPFVRSRTWQVINTTTWEASDNLTIKNIFSYAEAKEAYAYNIVGDNGGPFPFVEVNPGPNTPQGNQYTWTEELQFQGTAFNDRLTWQAGGYLERSKPIGGNGGQEQYTGIFADCSDIHQFQCSPLSLFGGAFVVGSANIARNVYSYRSEGLYAQGTYKLTDQFSLTGGFRYTWDWQDVNADNVRITPSPAGAVSFSCTRAVTPAAPDARLALGGFCTRTFVQKSSAPTWLIGLDFEPNDDVLIFAKYSRGYRGGGINESNIGVETWQPEKLDTYELGLKMEFRGTVSGRFGITGFWNEFSNQQATVVIPACIPTVTPGCTMPPSVGINGIQNVGKSRIRGVEADASFTFFDSLRLDLGYAFLDAKVTGTNTPICDSRTYDCANATFLSNVGSLLPYTPKHSFTATVSYTLPLDESLGEVRIGATFSHTADQFVSPANKAAFDAGVIPFDSGIVPAIDLLNLNLNWDSVGGSPVDIALFMTNVTNNKYYVAGGTSLTTIGGDFLFLGQPRMFGARVRFNIGQ
ncbi:MAG: TonB-dependent receptor [Novosphingobium sp.]|nr:TonB-dependent receptor [Novosphingobium sp.]